MEKDFNRKIPSQPSPFSLYLFTLFLCAPCIFLFPLSTRLHDFVADHVRDIPRSGIRDFFEIVQSMRASSRSASANPISSRPGTSARRPSTRSNAARPATLPISACCSLREAIAQYVSSDYQLAYDPPPKSSSRSASPKRFDLALRAVLNPGDEVLYHEPCYVSYSPSIALAHGKAVAIGTREEENSSSAPLRSEPRSRRIEGPAAQFPDQSRPARY